MKNVNGWMFPDEDEFMSKHIGKDGSYQRVHLEAAVQYTPRRHTAFDGGAHVGTWSRLLSSSFKRVIAIEPSADTFECLTTNLATFKCENVLAFQRATQIASTPARAFHQSFGLPLPQVSRGGFIHPS